MWFLKLNDITGMKGDHVEVEILESYAFICMTNLDMSRS